MDILLEYKKMRLVKQILSYEPHREGQIATQKQIKDFNKLLLTYKEWTQKHSSPNHT